MYKQICQDIKRLEEELSLLKGNCKKHSELKAQLIELQQAKIEAFKEFMGVGKKQSYAVSMEGGTRCL